MKNSPLPLLALVVCWCGPAFAEEPISFNYEIRPILSENCFACHGPDEEHRGADLRLDERQAALDHGAIAPGAPEQSLLAKRILSESPEFAMPPRETGKKLSTEQKELLVAWIQQGAPYQKHWSFESIPQNVPVPTVGGDWARNAIDRFVAGTHRKRGFQPNEETTRGAWLRRVTFDLTGLPPTTDELAAFLQDDAPDAYEKVVDRLLESPGYGERMANMWLDVARYADTFGYQNDVAMEVWPWRDWVIAAFNRNMPYDQFVTEQLAGDLLPHATDQQRLATAFNRLHRQTNEGGSIPEEFRLTGIADRTTTAGTAFMGLTLECCRCHDHKFDPIKQEDFYRFSAFFSDIDEFGLYSHFTRTQPTPAMLLYEGDQRQKHQQALSRIRAAEERLHQVLEQARMEWHEHAESKNRSLTQPRPPKFSMPLDGKAPGILGNATACNGDDQIVCKDAPLFGRTDSFSYSIWVHPAVQQPRMMVLHQSRAAEDSGFRGLQLTIDEGHPEFSMIHFWPGNAVRIRTLDTIPTNAWTHLVVTHDGSGSAAGLRLFVNGQLAQVDVVRDKLTRDIRHRKEWGDAEVGNIKLALAARFRDIGFRDGLLDELSVFEQQLSSAEVLALYHQVRPPDTPITLDEQTAVEHYLLTDNNNVAAAREQLHEARRAENELVTGIRQIMTMQHDDAAPPTHILQRGEYTAKGKQVTPGTPELGGIRAAGNDRLALARWLTNPRHPLTTRVMVNRMWHLFFGRGIVVTLEDFGSQGTPPSHPQLLDYLAREFIDNDWNLHWLCRQIVLSATYRQSSHATAEELARDPHNTYLARGPKHRLSAEQLRDSLLCTSGLLVKKIGGPSVMPYQPPGLWREAGTGKAYRQSTGDGLYRRSMYTFWKRTAPPPAMITFDATNRETCTPRRELTTTPLQALIFLNDPQYVEASRVLAATLIKTFQDDTRARWNELFVRLTSRTPSEHELAIVTQLYDEQLAYFEQDESHADEFLQVGTQSSAESMNPVDLAATTVVVQTLFAYDETIMLR